MRQHLQTTILTLLLCGSMCLAQTKAPALNTITKVPSTRILALGHRSSSITAEQRSAIMPKEVSATVRLYLDGKIDQWWVRQDGTGVVFLMNMSSVEEARALLETLPLGQAHLMQFEFIELGPLSPLRYLLNESSQPPK